MTGKKGKKKNPRGAVVNWNPEIIKWAPFNSFRLPGKPGMHTTVRDSPLGH